MIALPIEPSGPRSKYIVFLGPGFLEGVYEAALAVELQEQSIAFEQQVSIDVAYKGVKGGEFRLDLTVDSSLVLELKEVDGLLPIHKAQVLSYLKALGKTSRTPDQL